MKTTLQITLLSLLVLFVSCTKDKMDKPKIQIIYTDDVSPVKVKFKVSDNYAIYDWVFEEKYSSGDLSVPFESEHIYSKASLGKVSLTVRAGSESVTVSEDINIPELANKLEIEGFKLADTLLKLPMCDSIYIVKFEFYDGIKYKPSVYRFITKESIVSNTYQKFDTTVVFNVGNILRDSLTSYIITSVYKDVLNDPIHNGMANICETYYLDRNIFSNVGQIQSFSISSDIKYEVLLIGDWQP